MDQTGTTIGKDDNGQAQNARHGAASPGPRAAETDGAASPPVVRIRKYPNRRLYDTSRSRHLTHEGVLALLADGRTVQVVDSRSGADITNLVLLQILIERREERLRAIPTLLITEALTADVETLRRLGARALEAWRLDRSTDHASAPARPGAPASVAHAGSNAGATRLASPTTGSSSAPRSNGSSGSARAKARPKRELI